MASLMTTKFGSSGLDQVLSAHLDSLAVSPQAKQAVIPALLGIAKIAEVQVQVQPPRCVHLIVSYPFYLCFLITLSRLQCPSVTGCSRAAKF
jgi:hypothetical protein